MISRFAVAVILVVGGSSFSCVANQQKKTTLVCEDRAITGSHVQRPICFEKPKAQERTEDDRRMLDRTRDRTPRGGPVTDR